MIEKNRQAHQFHARIGADFFDGGIDAPRNLDGVGFTFLAHDGEVGRPAVGAGTELEIGHRITYGGDVGEAHLGTQAPIPQRFEVGVFGDAT